MRKLVYSLMIGVSFSFTALTHAETLSSLFVPAPTGSGTLSEIQYYADQYSEITTIGSSQVFSLSARREILRLKKQIADEVKTGLTTINHKDPGVGGYDITQLMSKKDIQSYALSCESSSASSILTYLLGKDISEDSVIAQIDKNFWQSPKLSVGIWGDPDKGFVGDISGSQRKLTGFGVYETPFLKIYTGYGLTSEKINIKDYTRLNLTPETHLTKILTSLESGKMVQLWGDYCTTKSADDGILTDVDQSTVDTFGLNAKNPCTSDSKDRIVTWKGVDKNLNIQTYSALIGEHNFFLLGWKGDIKNPTHIIVWDTITGRHVYSTTEWMRKWKTMDYRSIIISKP